MRRRGLRGYFPRRVPAFVAPLIGFALGALLAWFSAAAPRLPAPLRAGEPRKSLATRGRPLVLVALFAGLIFTPVCAYFLVFAPDWSFAYLIDSRHVPSAVDLLLLLLDAASVPAGFVAMHAAATAGGSPTVQRSARAVAALAGAPLAIAVIALLALSRRLALDGTYRQVAGDFGVQPVAGGPLGYALLWMHTMLAAGFAVTVRALLRGDAAPAPRPEPRPGDRRRAVPVERAPAADPPASAPSSPPRRLGVGKGATARRTRRET